MAKETRTDFLSTTSAALEGPLLAAGPQQLTTDTLENHFPVLQSLFASMCISFKVWPVLSHQVSTLKI